MLALTFEIYDSLFIQGEFYQLLPSAAADKIILRKHNGSRFELPENNAVEIFDGCKIKLGGYGRNRSFKLFFDAPRHVEIVRAAAYQKDDFQDDILVANVSERTIDQLLEEEFLVNPRFAQKFISACFSNTLGDINVISTHRSARQTQSGGDETDLLVIFTDEKDRSYGLMIENKITAGRQEQQPERYISRGINGIRAERWDVFETCLIAPLQYLELNQSKDYYHNYLSYEDIVLFLKESITDERRLAFRRKCFDDAIQKKEEFVRAPDLPAALEFVKSVSAAFAALLPGMSLKHGPANNKVIWYHLTAQGYPDGIQIIVQKEAVVIEFKLPKFAEILQGKESLFRENGYDFKMAKSSCTIRRSIAPINCLRPFGEQKQNIEAVAAHVRDMDDFLKLKILR